VRPHALAQFVECAFREADVLFIPTWPVEVPTLRDTSADEAEHVQRVVISLSRCTRSINYLGLPSLSVPCGFSENGMPVAFQLVGRPFGEATLFRIACAYQAATDWHTRKPPLAAATRA
jgi:aspartyl-tRNA(Asn)/glutamyl-tRNA(Gln) amidotransferase subunit A